MPPTPPTILVIEDDDTLRWITVHTLRRAGYHVLQTALGLPGLAAAQTMKPNLVLLDVYLPDIDGREVCYRIKQDPRLSSVFVAIISGVKISPQDQTSGYVAGADAYLVRPIPNHDLLARVESFLQVQQAREQLHQSEACYRALFEQISDLVLVYEPMMPGNPGRFIKINQAACRVLGYSEEEMLRLSLTDLTLPAEADTVALEQEMLHSQGRLLFEKALQTKNSERIPLEIHARLFELQGQPRVLAIARDLRERKRMEQALRQSESRYHAVFDNANIGIMRAAPDGVILEANPGLAQMLGYRAEDLRGRFWQSLTHPDDLPENQALHQQLLAGESRGYQMEKRYIRADGAPIWCGIGVSAVRNGDGRVGFTIKVIRDIEKRRQAEIQLLQAKDAAEAANRAKSTFLASISHELRTPLNAILGYAQILERAPGLTAEQRKDVAVIHHSGDYLLGLIEDILDLAKIEAGRFELQPDVCELPNLLRRVVEMLKPRADAKGIAFHARFSPALPALIRADSKRLRQILANLLSNAVKFTEHGDVLLQADYSEGQLRLEISDTGIGIAPADLERIFEPFQQAGGQKYNTQGTGLGLSITRKLVKLMGGELDVSSVPGQGSRFCVALPLLLAGATAQPRPTAPETERVIGYRRAPGQAPYRILVVDDTQENRQVVIKLLQPLGFILREAGDGEEALALAQAWQPDVILMDLVMPRLDGLEATRCLRRQAAFANTPVIAVSASTYDEDRRASLAAGCNAHLSKPICLGNLLEVLDQHLAITWEYNAQPSSPPVPAFDERDGLGGLTPAELENWLHLAKMGDIFGLSECFAEAGARVGGNPLLAALSGMADNLEVRSIVSLLRQVLAKNGGLSCH